MNEAQQALLLIKGLIYDQPEPDRDAIMEWADKFRSMLSEGGDNALVALTLIGAELQCAN